MISSYQEMFFEEMVAFYRKFDLQVENHMFQVILIHICKNISSNSEAIRPCKYSVHVKVALLQTNWFQLETEKLPGQKFNIIILYPSQWCMVLCEPLFVSFLFNQLICIWKLATFPLSGVENPVFGAIPRLLVLLYIIVCSFSSLCLSNKCCYNMRSLRPVASITRNNHLRG